MTREHKPTPGEAAESVITPQEALALGDMNSVQRRVWLDKYTGLWRRNPKLFIQSLHTVSPIAQNNPFPWELLTNKGRIDTLLPPGSSLPQETIDGFIDSDIFAPREGYNDHLRRALRNVFGSYLWSPMRAIQPHSKIEAEKLRDHFVSTYSPLARSFTGMARTAQWDAQKRNAIIPRLFNFLGWYEEECVNNIPGVGRIHPDAVAEIASGYDIDSVVCSDLNAAGVMFSLVNAGAYTLQTGEPKSSDFNAGNRLLSSRVKREMAQHKEHIGERLHSNLTSQWDSGLVEKMIAQVRSICYGSIGSGRVAHQVFPEYVYDDGKRVQLGTLAASVVEFAALTYIAFAHRTDTGDMPYQVVPLPGGSFGIVGGKDAQQARTAHLEFQKIVQKSLSPDSISGLTMPQLATCLNFLFERSNPAEQTARIAALNQTITSSPQRLHSRGYSIVFSDDRLTSIGLTGMALRQAGQGFAAVMRFFERDIPVTIDAQGSCIFPEGFDDPRSQANVELIVKSHIDEIMRTDVTREQTSGTPGNVRPASADSGGETVSPSGAHFRVMEPGKRSLQIYHGKDPRLYIDASPEPVQTQESGGADSPPNPKRRMGNGEVNTRVMEWLGVDLEILNTLFHVLQQSEGDMAKAMADNALMREARPDIRAKLTTLYERVVTKNEKLMRQTLKDGAEHDLACELSYVPEHTSRNSPSEPIELAITMAPEAYRSILPKGQTPPPSGRVFSAQ